MTLVGDSLVVGSCNCRTKALSKGLFVASTLVVDCVGSKEKEKYRDMLCIRYVFSRALVWAVFLWLSLQVLFGNDILRTLRTGKVEISTGVLYLYLALSSFVMTYQMLLNQRLIQDVVSSIFSFSCDLLVLLIFLVFFFFNHRMQGVSQNGHSWGTAATIALSLLLANKWKNRMLEIRADHTVSRFLKSFSVHVIDKSIKAASLLFSLFMLKELLSIMFVTVIARRPISWSFKLWRGIAVVTKGLWYNFLLDYSMVSLEYFLFHPINFTQSPWVQVIPKMGVRAIKGVSAASPTASATLKTQFSQQHQQQSSSSQTGTTCTNTNTLVGSEIVLMDYLHGLCVTSESTSSPTLSFVPRHVAQTGKTLLKTVHDIYHQQVRRILRENKRSLNNFNVNNKNVNVHVPPQMQQHEDTKPSSSLLRALLDMFGMQQFVFTAASSPLSTSSTPLLAPIYAYLECQAFFDLHRITRSSKLRREPLFQVHFDEWLSGTLNFFLNATLQMKELQHFVKDAYNVDDFLRDIARLTHNASFKSLSPNNPSNRDYHSIGVDSLVQTQAALSSSSTAVTDSSGAFTVDNKPFTFPRSPLQRQQTFTNVNWNQNNNFSNKNVSLDSLQQNSFVSSSASQSSSSSSSLQSLVLTFLLPTSWTRKSASFSASSASSTNNKFLNWLDQLLLQGEHSCQMFLYLLVGALYQFMGFIWQLPLRGEVSERQHGGGEITASLRKYFTRMFSPLYAQEIVNALDATATCCQQALREDKSAAGLRSTRALLSIVYVLLQFEESIEEIIDLLHQTHTTKVSMAKALSALPTSNNTVNNTTKTVEEDASRKQMTNNVKNTSNAVGYRRFKLKSLQLLPREIIALRRGVKEAIARIWQAYVDVLLVQELPQEVQAKALEYRQAALLSQQR